MHNRSALRPSPVPQVPGQVPSSNMHNTATLRKAIGRYYKELEEYKSIVRLVGQVITVSADTVWLVNGLQQAVKIEDWMGEIVGHHHDDSIIEEVKHG